MSGLEDARRLHRHGSREVVDFLRGLPGTTTRTGPDQWEHATLPTAAEVQPQAGRPLPGEDPSAGPQVLADCGTNEVRDARALPGGTEKQVALELRIETYGLN